MLSSLLPPLESPLFELDKENAPPVGVLVAVQTRDIDDDTLRASLAELRRLAKTFGIEVVGQATQRLAVPAKAMYLGPGKVEEVKAQVEEVRAEHPDRPVVVIADDELSPWQNRKLAEALGVDDLMDRTELILEIFHRHARSREAKAQVELVRLAYQAPRLRERRKGGDAGRVRGGGKGAGESALELGRRQIRDRMAQLRQELEEIGRERDIQRARREELRCVALVGYTNAGKSTLMRALTDSDVYVEDKLFATLDATVRTLEPAVSPRILVSDTVGFIRKLPHDLVASFKSTLDAALEARLLLHIVDASDVDCRIHIETTLGVLREIGAGEIAMRYVFNKIDRVTDPAVLEALAVEYPEAMFISAHDPADVTRVHEAIVGTFQGARQGYTFRIAPSQGAIRAMLFEQCEVIDEQWDAEGGTFHVRATPVVIERINERLASTASRRR